LSYTKIKDIEVLYNREIFGFCKSMAAKAALALGVLFSVLSCDAFCPARLQSQSGKHVSLVKLQRLPLPSKSRGSPPTVIKQFHQLLSRNSRESNTENESNIDESQSNESNDFEWKVGNLEDDFQALEQAIRFENAEANLQEAERIEIMNTFAKQRRLILPDVHKFVTSPLRWSLLFVLLQRLLQHRSSNNPVARFMARHQVLTLPWDIQFWLTVVVAPILFLQFKKWTMPPPIPIPEDLKGLDPEYLRFTTTDWEEPSTSCRDYVLCLTEQWVSAVKGAAWLGAIRLIFFFATHLPKLSHSIRVLPYFQPTVVALLQLFTRLGAMVSLHQFPKLIFQLERQGQQRPIKGDVAYLQKLVHTMFHWGVPIGIGADLSQVLLGAPKRGLVIFYASAVAILGCMEILFSPSRKPASSIKKSKRVIRPGKMITAIQILGASGVLAFFIGKTSLLFLHIFVFKKKLVVPRIPWQQILFNGTLLLAFIRPVCHLRAFSKILRVVYMHDMSLASNVREMHSDPQEVESRYKWRYRLRWREPERIHVVMDKIADNWAYWFFVKGSVEDKLEKEDAAQRKKELDNSSTKIWQLAEIDMELNPFAPQPNRDTWKEEAMERVAKIHQRDYDDKNFSDPLGVAVQQRLGIGLMFMQDHTRRLEPGEKPSARRLQARAAKSAVAHVSELYQQLNEKTAEIMQRIEDPTERQNEVDRIKQEVDNEVSALATRLSNLIPNEADPEDDGLRFHNMFPNALLPSDRSVAVASLLRKYGKPTSSSEFAEAVLLDERNEESIPSDRETDEINDEGNSSDNSRDEYVEAYLKQKFGGNKKSDKDDDGHDHDIILT